MSAPLDPVPSSADVIAPDNRTFSRDVYLWLFGLWTRVKTLIQLVGTPLSLTNQSAAIATRTIFAVIQNGVYRVEYWIEVTQIPTTSYSLTVTLSWRDNSVTKSQAFTALTGAPGTLALGFQTNALPLIRCDSGTSVSIAVAYASVGATVCVYRVDACVELLN